MGEYKRELSIILDINISEVDSWVEYVNYILPTEEAMMIIDNTSDPERVKKILIELDTTVKE